MALLSKRYTVAPRLGWMAVRAASSRCATTEMSSSAMSLPRLTAGGGGTVRDDAAGRSAASTGVQTAPMALPSTIA